jgi:arthrofactin-type cyclic lipopeptide synthetase C
MDVLDGASIPFALVPARVAAARRLALSTGTSLFEVLAVAWSALLHRWLGQERSLVVLEPDASCRPEYSAAGTLSVAVTVEPKCSTRSILTHRSSPRADTRLDVISKRAHNINLSLTEKDDGSVGGVATLKEMRADLNAPERVAESWTLLLDDMVARPDAPLAELALLSDSERERVLFQFNATQTPFPENALLHELFESQAARTPGSIAVEFEERSLTYAELNQRADRLAAFLRQRGIGPDRLVGVCLERSIEMVVALVGILKAGGAYVPLDPNYPPDRLRHMVADAAPSIVITQEKFRPLLNSMGVDCWAFGDEEGSPEVDNTVAFRGEPQKPTSSNLAYVIYTSGSTGKPKGAMNEHRAVVNRLIWMQSAYQLSADDRVLQKTPFSFDVSVWEFFWPLICGARIVVARPQGHQDPDYLRQLIERVGVTVLHFVPSMLQVFLNQREALDCHNLRQILCSGEELSESLQRQCLARLPTAKLSNLYGPTEAAIDVTAWDCRITDSGRVPIGRPIANVRMYVLDPQRRPVPVGAVGELYIGGIGVGRGYLNRPDLTAERFIADPYSQKATARLYKTGDLGRWLPNGAIEYLGRNDFQVKVRGFRIELGEIEARLMEHPAIKEATVIAREDVSGEKRLVAYLVTAESSEPPPTAATLRSHLAAALPEHMLPSAFLLLESLPLSPNGKLDRHALPAPREGDHLRRPYADPQGQVERRLARIWADVLHVRRVGRWDHFYELGGDSLLAVQVAERLGKANLRCEVRSALEHPVLADLASAIANEQHDTSLIPSASIPVNCARVTPEMVPLAQLTDAEIATVVQTVPGGSANLQDIYPLAPLQAGILFHHLLGNQGGDTYVLPTLLRMSSRENLDAFISALQVVIDRHDILRTAVLWDGLSKPVQVVYRQAPLPLEEFTLSGAADVDEQLQKWMQPDQQHLKIERAPLLRLRTAWDPAGRQWFAILQLHHLAHDHESLDVMLGELMDCLRGAQHKLLPPVPYRNHIARILAQSQRFPAEPFFRAKLATITDPTAPFGLTDVKSGGSRIDEFRCSLEPELARQARLCARMLGVGVAALFHAAWAMVLAHTGDSESVVFGTVMLDRPHSAGATESQLGMFINTLPIRLDVAKISARDLVLQAQQELIALLRYQHAPLSVAQKCSGVIGKAPLFSTLLNFLHSPENAATLQTALAPGIEVLCRREWTNYPIALSIEDLGTGFSLIAQTDRRVPPDRITGYMRQALESLVEALQHDADRRALQLSILPASERIQLLEGFNSTRTVYPSESRVEQIFEQVAQSSPGAVAIIEGERSINYASLNARANQLARYLQDRGVSPGQLVPIVLMRSLEMVIAQLAVLKCGAAYVPIDPTLPVERRRFMLQDCGARRVLGRQSADLSPDSTAVEWIDYDSAERSAQRLSSESLHIVTSDNPAAYVMYTSGSTGVPKGVIVAHRGVTRLVINSGASQITAEDCVAHASNPAFDAATYEVWSALLNGARLVIVPQEVLLDPLGFATLLQEKQVSALFLTVGLLSHYVETLSGVFAQLRLLITGGDVVEPALARRILKAGPPTHLLNAYGPTENTTFTTTYCVNSVDADATSLPIGKPVSNTRVYILDAERQLVPIGAIGELYLGGDGVALGYLERPDLTEERFIPDPFSNDPSARLYKSGDLGRWRADGAIEFLGRNDQQVKVRGFRIELGEIEQALLRHATVRDAIVIARQDKPGDKRLVAYFTVRHGAQATPEELRGHLESSVPEYMIPGAFVQLESVPLNANGKVDRPSLPMPSDSAYVERRYQAPQGEVEGRLAAIWAEVLGVGRIGRDSDFMELGGHSLLAMQVIVRIRARFSINLSVNTILEYPSLRLLAGKVEELRTARVLQRLEGGEGTIQELLERVSTMSEGQARALVGKFRKGARK